MTLSSWEVIPSNAERTPVGSCNKVMMVNYLMGHVYITWRFFLCSAMLHIIYSWQSYYVLAREFKLRVSRKCIHFFVAEVGGKGKAVVANRYFCLVISGNLDLIESWFRLSVGHHLTAFV